MAEKVSGRKLAKALGVSEAAVRKMRAKGQIQPLSRGRGGRGADEYDLEQARVQRQANVQPRVAAGSGDNTLVQLAKAEKVEKIKRLRMENEQKRGEYVPVAPIRALLGELAITIQNLFTRMVLEQADEIAPENPAEFKVRAQTYVDRALHAISQAIAGVPDPKTSEKV